MKKLSILPVVAVLSLSATTLAEGPTRDQTIQYIKERCLGNPWGPRDQGTVSMALDGTILTLRSASLLKAEPIWRGIGVFDLRDVDISAVDYEGGASDYEITQKVIMFLCGNKCISLSVSYYNSDGTVKDQGKPFGLGSQKLRCNEPEKVVKAFTHLQTLVGGKKQDLFGD
ncbi:hypothetical protein [Kordiimonas sp.]|uniref:hypothetical protein n=1 Tax=Kordiimonas sp. TaxID=1970157 RepID=UPI003A93D67D